MAVVVLLVVVVDQLMKLITSQPLKSIKDRIRLTEQGEVIGNKYGNKDAAYYNLENVGFCSH